MKRTIYCAVAIAILTAVACKSNDTASQKIDFTQSYENAALALTSAQNNYNTALSSNDTARMNKARQELATATNNYVTSKNILVQHGGTVKQQYESNLTQSEQALSKTSVAVPAAATNGNAAAQPDSTIGGKVGQVLDKGSQKLENAKNTVHTTTANTLDKADQTLQNIAAKKAKAQQGIQDTKGQVQKSAQETQEKAKKLKDDLNSLFK